MGTMVHYTLPYGRSTLDLVLPDEVEVTWLVPANSEPVTDTMQVVAAALDAPRSGPSLADLSGVHSAAIAINDKTRPVPHAALLPPLLERLEALGLAPEQITLIIATGTHPPMPAATFSSVLPEVILARYPVISHDCDAGTQVNLGTTSRGTPVRMNRRFLQSDLRVVVGNIEPHHFAGYSGGVKTAAIGLSSRTTIAANHALLRDLNALLAEYERNPLRQDIEEIGTMAGIQLALNVVMNDHKQIVSAFAGEPRAVMEAGIPVVQSLYQVPVPQPFDVVITCPGGYPKDINLYQAHKAVSCANRVTKPGGGIVLVAACEEGPGSDGWERYMARGFASHAEAMEQFVREPFVVGPHKAFIFGRDAVRVRDIWIVSEIEPERVRRLLLHPASLETAIAEALAAAPRKARVGIMPYANATIPVLSPRGADDEHTTA